MSFGLTNVPATFQCIINSILEPLLRMFVMVFMDGILIYSRSLEEHVDHIRHVLHLFVAHRFYVKRSKCAFAQSELEYLGYIISKKGVATNPKKTQAMMD
jgi:hypothetical protein